MPKLTPLAAIGALLLAGCGGTNGLCTIDLGEGPITVALLVTESECRQICDSQYGRDDCVWEDRSDLDNSGRITGPGL